MVRRKITFSSPSAQTTPPAPDSVRLYGRAPFSLALVHGGPGARGSLAGAAAQIGRTRGVVEPLQTRGDIPALLEELDAQLSLSTDRWTLAGHSWGAWLCLLYAAYFPKRVKQLVLIACPPLSESFVPQILQRRLAALTQPQAAAFTRALHDLQSTPENPQALHTVETLTRQTDFVNPCPYDDHLLEIDARQYRQIWPQAQWLRSSGKLLQAAQGLRCPVSILHGKQDPHPAEGAILPLKAIGIQPEVVLWDRCGHSPFAETDACEAFYQFFRDLP